MDKKRAGFVFIGGGDPFFIAGLDWHLPGDQTGLQRTGFISPETGRNPSDLFLYFKVSDHENGHAEGCSTHLLSNPDQYITRVGKFLRRTSLDELPQIFNILKGEMSIIGPRPALWNQQDLLTEREKYGANDVMPGLTGWAQINGRDELEIPEKAKLDGEYVKRIGFGMDVRCFVGTIASVIRSKGVVEGGTGVMKKDSSQNEKKISIKEE